MPRKEVIKPEKMTECERNEIRKISVRKEELKRRN